MLGRLLSKYCAEFIELIAFLIAVAFAERPTFVLSQTRTMKSALNGSVCPCISAAIFRSFFCMTVSSESFFSLA